MFDDLKNNFYFLFQLCCLSITHLCFDKLVVIWGALNVHSLSSLNGELFCITIISISHSSKFYVVLQFYSLMVNIRYCTAHIWCFVRLQSLLPRSLDAVQLLPTFWRWSFSLCVWLMFSVCKIDLLCNEAHLNATGPIEHQMYEYYII